jgi:dihydroorotate dehydrogenase
MRRSQVRAKETMAAPCCLGLNIGKNATTPIEEATSDYIKALDGVYPHADYVTVNISSPNTKNLRACKATRHWMLCCAGCQSPRTAFQPAWQARRCS